MISWHCAHTKPRAEIWARTNLWDRGYEVYLPQYLKDRSHARRTERVPAPLFPRYLFIKADLSVRGSRGISFSPGIHSLVCFGGPPAIVPETVISELRSHENENGMVDIDFGKGASSRFSQGDRVLITSGALLGQVGIFHCREDKHRAVILLNLLGGSIRSCIPAQDLSLG